MGFSWAFISQVILVGKRVVYNNHLIYLDFVEYQLIPHRVISDDTTKKKKTNPYLNT